MRLPDTESTHTPAAQALLEAMPVFALNTVLYPGGPLPLRIFEPRYVDMVSDRLRRDAPFIVALIRDGSEVGGGASTHSVGTLARIVDWNRGDDGLLGITALGGRRVQVLATETRPDGLCVATARMREEPASRSPAITAGWSAAWTARSVESTYRHVTPRYDDATGSATGSSCCRSPRWRLARRVRGARHRSTQARSASCVPATARMLAEEPSVHGPVGDHRRMVALLRGRMQHCSISRSSPPIVT